MKIVNSMSSALSSFPTEKALIIQILIHIISDGYLQNMQHFLRLSRPVSTEEAIIKIVRNHLTLHYAGFGVLSAVVMQNYTFWDAV
jgi:hypothetical protein